MPMNINMKNIITIWLYPHYNSKRTSIQQVL